MQVLINVNLIFIKYIKLRYKLFIVKRKNTCDREENMVTLSFKMLFWTKNMYNSFIIFIM